jgi:coatomer subunit beta'
MDTSGKIVYARNTEILTANVSNVGADGEWRPCKMTSTH